VVIDGAPDGFATGLLTTAGPSFPVERQKSGPIYAANDRHAGFGKVHRIDRQAACLIFFGLVEHIVPLIGSAAPITTISRYILCHLIVANIMVVIITPATLLSPVTRDD